MIIVNLGKAADEYVQEITRKRCDMNEPDIIIMIRGIKLFFKQIMGAWMVKNVWLTSKLLTNTDSLQIQTTSLPQLVALNSSLVVLRQYKIILSFIFDNKVLSKSMKNKDSHYQYCHLFQ